MFHSIPDAILQRMHFLESIDAADRNDGTPRLQRLRQIPPDTGKFLALLAASSPSGAWIEVGTSGGYSALWLSLAARATGNRLVTCENDPAKVAIARETFSLAGVEDVVELVEGDALAHIQQLPDISFCFLDAEKEVYAECYDLVIPKLVSCGLLVADNVISHRDELQPFVDRALSDVRIDALVVPLGKGELVCRKIG
ncbi:O-methyltransferase [Calditrichota bacterium]